MELLSEERARCPFCGEAISLLVDLSVEEQSYIEDCQVCCRPMQVSVDVDNGELQSIHVDCAS